MQAHSSDYYNLITTAAVFTSLSGMFSPNLPTQVICEASHWRWMTITDMLPTGFCVVLRLFIRFFVVKKPQWDDYTILLAIVLTLGYMAELVIGGAKGMGTPFRSLTISEMVTFMKVVFSIEVTYYILVNLVKISILLAYLRFGMCSRHSAPRCRVHPGHNIVSLVY